jgi:hypothetical protein
MRDVAGLLWLRLRPGQDASHAGRRSITALTDRSTYDEDEVSRTVAERHRAAAGRCGGEYFDPTVPTQRDRLWRMIAERGRLAWQKASGRNLRAKVEASSGRYKRVIGDAASTACQSDRGDRGCHRCGCADRNWRSDAPAIFISIK